jgi:hypothetical protein
MLIIFLQNLLKNYAMHSNEIIGFAGVLILLLAFFLNSFKFLKQTDKSYILLNLFGAAIACYASFLINYLPFVILEAAWAFVALIALMKVLITRNVKEA